MVRPRVHARPPASPPVALAVAVALLVAACSSDAAGPSTSGTPAASTAAVGTTPAPERTPPASTSPSGTSPSTVSLSGTSPPGTAASVDPEVREACTTLATAGYVTRSEHVAALDAGTLTAVGATCPGDLARLRAAQEIERRAAVIAPYPLDAMLADLRCEGGRFSFTFTNRTPEPVGGNFVVYLWAPTGGAAVGGAAGPVVAWSVEPGATVELAGGYPEPSVAFDDCGVRGELFLADRTPADAGLDTPRDAALTGDDPAEWLLALYRREHERDAGVDRDGAADTEDLRSVAWPRVLATASIPMVSRDTAAVEVCAVERPDPHHVAVLHRALIVAGQAQVDGKVRVRGIHEHLSVGVFRRGSDGQWRWLGTSQHVALEAAGDCPQR